MAGSSNAVKLAVPAALIQHLKSANKVLVAENVINQNGLHWSSSYPGDTVFISGSSQDVLEFAVECLESLLDKSRNPLCCFTEKRLEFIFKGTLGKKILESETILTKECVGVFVYDLKDSSEVNVRCVYDDYSKIRKTIDQIRYSTSLSTDRSILLDKSPVRGRSQYNGHPGSSSTPLVHFQLSKFQYSFKTNNIHVYVYKASITDVTGIDAIVNAANEDLRHESGVAYTICVAAGSSVKNQCSDHLSKHGRVPVGDNCVTGPGNLMHLKAIIHAVGPRWDDYPEKKKCAMTLHETVIHVLRTAHTKSLHKIALPSISAGMFKVPKDLCAEMYIKAVMDYSRDAKPNYVTEIHFVDVKDDILKAIREAHEKWKKSPALLDFKNALKHAPPQGGAVARPLERSHSNSVRGAKAMSHHPEEPTSVRVCFIKDTTLPYTTSKQYIFSINNDLWVHIYTGSIIRVDKTVTIVCSVGESLKGGKLADALVAEGGEEYKKALEELKKKNNIYPGHVYVCSGGRLRAKNVLLAVMNAPVKDVEQKTFERLKMIYIEIFRSAGLYSITSLATPLIGTGRLPSIPSQYQCCCVALLDALIEVKSKYPNHCLKTLKLVNVDEQKTGELVRVFKQRSGSVPVESHRNKLATSQQFPKQKSSDIFPHGNQKPQAVIEEVRTDEWLEKPRVHKPKNMSRSLSYNPSRDHDDTDKDAKSHKNEPQRNLPDTGDGVLSWMEPGHGGKAGNLNIIGVEASDQLMTYRNLKMKKLSETCHIGTCDKTAEKALACGHKFCQICFIPVERNLVCTICPQHSLETMLGASYSKNSKTRQKPVDDAQVKTRSEQLYKNTCASSSSNSEKDTEVIKLEEKLRDLEAKKIAVIKEKRKKELVERIRQAVEDLTVMSVPVGKSAKRFPAGTKHEQSNESTPSLSSSAVEKDREEIELEQKLRELEEKKVTVFKERRKIELKEKIKQLEEDLSVMEAVPAEDTEEEDKKCIFCTDVLRNPQKLGCGHEFCSKCIGEAIEYQEACPVCRTKFGDAAENQQGLSIDALLSLYNSSDFIENS